MSAGDLRHLRPGRELELVARDARAGDLAGDASPRRRTRRACGRGGRRSARPCRRSCRGAAGERRSSVRSGSRYSECSDDVSKTDSDALEVRLGLVGMKRAARLSEARRADDVRVGLRAVEQPLRQVARAQAGGTSSVLRGLRLARRPVERAPRTGAGALHHVARAPEDRAGRGAADEEQTRREAARRRRSQRRSRPMRARQRAADREPDQAAVVLAEERHQAEEARPRRRAGTAARRGGRCARAGARPIANERERKDVGRVADDVLQHVGEPRADRAAVEAEVEDRRRGRGRARAARARGARSRGASARRRCVRFFTREGTRGRSGRFFLRAAMLARFDAGPRAPLAVAERAATRTLRARELRRRRARHRRGCRSRGSRPSPPRDPCRPGRSARSRSAARPGCRGRRSARIHAGSFSGTQRIFSSGPFSSAMWKTPTTRAANPAAGERGLADEDERVERVAVAAQRPLDEPVVRRVRHRGEQAPVEDDRAELLVELVLVPRARRNLDEDDDVLGHAWRLTEAIRAQYRGRDGRHPREGARLRALAPGARPTIGRGRRTSS